MLQSIGLQRVRHDWAMEQQQQQQQYIYIYIYTIFFIFFSIMVYYRVLNIVLCAIQ